MPVAAYYAWERLGRPLTPAEPIREFVEKLRIIFPDAGIFSWYADDAHYQANFPEDHTPFSVTGWPEADPPWFVCATDVMHRPDLGVDCDVLVPYWLAEARAGRMPWLKYLIWQAQLYDVRNGWEPVGNSDHFDHCHLSSRTDHLYVTLGDWSPVPTTKSTARRAPDMIGIRDPEGGEFTADMSPLAVGGYYYTPVVSADRSAALQAGGVVMQDGLRPGIFGPSAAEVREQLLVDVAAKVVASLPPGQGGGPTLAQITAAVRAELDKTKLPSVPGTLGH